MSIKGIKVELSFKDEKTGKYYAVPVLPERIGYTNGSKQVNTANIIDLGAVDFLRGVDLDSMTWSSFFPARYDASYVSVVKPLKPNQYKDLFVKWKNEGTPLRIISPAAGINKQVYLSSFSWDLRGAEGDIYYSVTIRERKTIKPIMLPVNKPAPSKNKKTPAKRTPVTTPPKPKTYTVVRGDSLTKIAKKFKIANWHKDLYLPNKKPKGPLGTNPSLILPGQKLKLP